MQEERPEAVGRYPPGCFVSGFRFRRHAVRPTEAEAEDTFDSEAQEATQLDRPHLVNSIYTHEFEFMIL